MNMRHDHTAGFSLVEVALALGIAAIALVAIIGLIPVGLNNNQTSSGQTAAAGIAAAVVADLRATPVAVPPAPKKSPRYQLPLPASGNATHALFLKEDGSGVGAVDADIDPSQDPRYRVTLSITAPGSATQKGATIVRVLITWPAVADPQAAVAPTKFSGSYEVLTALNRN
jgi:Tfp pilus assembly protein PilV